MNVLLLGSSFSALPILMNLKKRGANVTVAGKYIHDPCHVHTHSSVYVDYSDHESLSEVCRNGTFDAIVPSCNDYAYLAAAQMAEKFGFPGFDDLVTTKIVHEKNSFRQLCATINIPAPQVFSDVTDPDDLVNFPNINGAILVKPVDSFSGRGVRRIDDIKELNSAITHALTESRIKRAVIEEFVSGSLHSHTAFVSAGKIVWYELVDEFCEVYPYQVDRSTYPSILSEAARTTVTEIVSKIVKELQLVDGLLHTQFIMSGEKFWIIECMRRCPGDLYGYHFQLGDGIDYVHQYVSPFLGVAPEAPTATKSKTRVERQIISVSEQQLFFGATTQVRDQRTTFIPLKESGQLLGTAPFDKAGIVFFEELKGEKHQVKDEGISTAIIGV